MSFMSYSFVLFTAVCVLAAYLLPARWQNTALLAANFAFYAFAAPRFVPLLALTVAVSYAAARGIDAAADPKRRKLLFSLSLLLLLGLLFTFKYFNFFSDLTASLLGVFGLTVGATHLSLVLPLGISFYTLQSVGYLIDVKNGVVPAERSFVDCALFVSFFPQLLSGPIGRAKALLPQYKAHRAFDAENLLWGIRRFVTGLFKKAVIADGFALFVDTVWGNMVFYNTRVTSLVVIALYAFEIYFDFAGYSDMAVGVGRMFGIVLPENFLSPYLSRNFSEFWSRWHISLSSWLQDYVFVPLVWSRWANKLVFGRRWQDHAPHFAANFFIVFLLSGLWHGASVCFVVWGLLQGLFRWGEELVHKALGKRPHKLTSPLAERARHAGKSLIVFSLFALSLVFFRAPQLSDAFALLRNVLSGAGDTAANLYALFYAAMGTGARYAKLSAALLAASFALGVYFDFRLYNAKGKAVCDNDPLAALSTPCRILGAAFMILCILLIGQFGASSFIYYQF